MSTHAQSHRWNPSTSEGTSGISAAIHPDPQSPGVNERQAFASRGLDNIQALRAIAALMVVLIHLDQLVQILNIKPFGGSGVDLFFVISGFIMVYTTYGCRITPTDFLSRRIARVVPLYWLLTLAVFAVALLTPSLLQLTSADPWQLLKSLLFVPFAKSNGDVQPTLFLGWTLNYEMFFYALFAIGLLFSNRLIGIVVVIAALVSIVTAGALFHPRGIVTEFYSQPIILEFAGGMLVGLAARRGWLELSSVTARIGLGTLSLVTVIWIVYGPSNLPRHLAAGIPAFTVVAVAVGLNQSGAIITNATVLRLGDASYSIYLTHAFLTQTVLKLAHRIDLNPPIAAALIVLTFGLVCLTGLVVHHNVEHPLIRGYKSMTARLRMA